MGQSWCTTEHKFTSDSVVYYFNVHLRLKDSFNSLFANSNLQQKMIK